LVCAFQDNGSLSNYDSEQWILVESGDQPTTEVQPVSLVGVVPQRKQVNRANQQVRSVAPAPQKKARQTCNGPSVKFLLQKSIHLIIYKLHIKLCAGQKYLIEFAFKVSTGKEAATAPLPNPPAPQRPSVSTNRSNSAPVGRTVSINSQARLIKGCFFFIVSFCCCLNSVFHCQFLLYHPVPK
jgi:hypothetical protein